MVQIAPVAFPEHLGSLQRHGGLSEGLHDGSRPVSHSIIIFCGSLGRHIGETHGLIQVFRSCRLAQQFVDGVRWSQKFKSCWVIDPVMEALLSLIILQVILYVELVLFQVVYALQFLKLDFFS